MTVERLLNSVGKRTFVKYFYNFKNQSSNYCIMHFQEDFTDKAKASKTSHAKTIFKENKETEALQLIIKSSRVDEGTRLIAKGLLLEMQLKNK